MWLHGIFYYIVFIPPFVFSYRYQRARYWLQCSYPIAKSKKDAFNIQGVCHLLSPLPTMIICIITGHALIATWERAEQLYEFITGNRYQCPVAQYNTFRFLYTEKKNSNMKYRESVRSWSLRFCSCDSRFPLLCLVFDLSFRFDISFDFATFQLYHISI